MNQSIIKTKVIAGQNVKITLQPSVTRFGTVWTADNDYGEPKNQVKGFNSSEEALRNETKGLEQMLS